MIQPAVTLPEPDDAARQRSRELAAAIVEACRQHGGSIPFSAYMQMVLYHPGLGYYSGGLQKFGAAGDFVTAPELSPIFSQCVARQVAQVVDELGRADVFEFGAGSGVMAADMLLELEQREALPENYYILELGAELRQRQKQTIAEKAPHLLARVRWLDGLPERAIEGVVVANEVLDAMPVECFRVNEGVVERLYIAAAGDRLRPEYMAADENLAARVRLIEQGRDRPFETGYCSELNPALPAWLAGLYTALSRGVVLLIDYGYVLREYYLDERSSGTLICHYQHRAHADPLWYPGLQDITAFVDFSSVAQAADEAGFDVCGYTTQAMFLMACGLGDLHQSMASDDPRRQIVLAQQIKTLTLPSEMGERFKVMALGKKVELELIGFSMQDYRNRL
jgi:SAM-dependent MidA family methyltransferase